MSTEQQQRQQFWKKERSTINDSIWLWFMCVSPSSMKSMNEKKSYPTRASTKQHKPYYFLSQHLPSQFQFCNLQTGRLVHVIADNACAEVAPPMEAAEKKKKSARSTSKRKTVSSCTIVVGAVRSTDKLLSWFYRNNKKNKWKNHNGAARCSFRQANTFGVDCHMQIANAHM